MVKFGNSEVVELLVRVVDDFVKGEYIILLFDFDSFVCIFIGNLKIIFLKILKKGIRSCILLFVGINL